MKRGLKLWMIGVFAVGLTSCAITRRIPQGEYLVDKTATKVERQKELHKSEQVHAMDLDKFIRQQPSRRLMGTNIPLGIYMSVPTESKTWWSRTKRKIGAAPVYMDSTQTRLSLESMKIYLDERGFLNSTTSYRIDTLEAKRRVKISYQVNPGSPYRIREIHYEFRDDFLRPIILKDTTKRLIKVGDIFDATVLDNERARLTAFLKERGYYNLSINNFSYIADSTVGDHKVDLTLVVKRHMAGYNREGEVMMENNSIYRIRDIYVFPNYNPAIATRDPLYSSRLDTTQYRGLNIVYDTKMNVRPKIIRQSINLFPNDIYNARFVKTTYDDLMRLGYYRSTSILFSELSDSTQQERLVTFVGGDSLSGANIYTSERLLRCNILCTPATLQSYTVELEGVTSANYFGFKSKITYQNRNLFRGAELFEVGILGGYEFMRVQFRKNGRQNSFELGGNVGFTFPRFITPIRVDRYNRTYNPRTRIDFAYSEQRRPVYHRTLSSAVLGYQWGNRKHSTFLIRPIDVSIVKLRDVDPEFIASLKNPYLEWSFTDQLIAGLSTSYIYNNQRNSIEANSSTLRVNFETNGNLIGGFARWLGSPQPSKPNNPTDPIKEQYRIFGIPYAQYIRLDGSFTQRFVLGRKTSLVYRFYTGIGYAYGNSISIPFERLFFAGGPNSMRGWLPRTLGPGSATITNTLFPIQLGNFKLEGNIEGRFPVWGMLQGALFVDVGNIWFIGQGGDADPKSRFQFNNFYTQLGVNTGVGARFDFDFFVFRLDWGIQLHNPNKMHEDSWIKTFNVNNTALSFAVGYPF